MIIGSNPLFWWKKCGILLSTILDLFLDTTPALSCICMASRWILCQQCWWRGMWIVPPMLSEQWSRTDTIMPLSSKDSISRVTTKIHSFRNTECCKPTNSPQNGIRLLGPLLRNNSCRLHPSRGACDWKYPTASFFVLIFEQPVGNLVCCHSRPNRTGVPYAVVG